MSTLVSTIQRPDEVSLRNIGSRIRARREQLGLTLQRLGELAEIDVSQLSKVERGEGGANPSTLDRILYELGLSLRLVSRGRWWSARKGKERSSRRLHASTIPGPARGS